MLCYSCFFTSGFMLNYAPEHLPVKLICIKDNVLVCMFVHCINFRSRGSSGKEA